jgi:hypothetical protein
MTYGWLSKAVHTWQLSNGGGEIGEPSVILSSYLRDIYTRVLSFFATLPLRGIYHLGTCPAELSVPLSSRV